MLIAQTALGRFGQADDKGSAVAFIVPMDYRTKD